jgi:hypothetical protein
MMEENLSNFSHLDIQDYPTNKYYILVKETIIKRLKDSFNENICKVYPGQLVESIGAECNDKLIVRLQVDTNDKWYNVEWKCNLIDLRLLSPLIWKLLCSVSSLQERIRLVYNEQLCKDIESIKVDSKVWYCPNNTEKYLVKVKYIGALPKLGAGYYFGIDALVRKILFIIVRTFKTVFIH